MTADQGSGAKRRGVALFMALSLAACSPYAFTADTGRFAKAARDLATAAEGAPASILADRTALMRTQLADGSIRSVRIGSCDRRALAAQPEQCELSPFQPSEIQPTAILTAEERSLLRGIRLYANSLEALTRSSDRQAMDAASGTVASAVADLGGTINPAAPAVIRPFVSGGLFLVGQALDYERYLQLREAVELAHPLLVSRQERLGELLSKLRQARIRPIMLQLADLDAGMARQAAEPQRLWRFDMAVARRDVLLPIIATNPMATARDFIKAHEALREALRSTSTNAMALVNVVEAFVTQAEAIRAGLSAR